MQDPEKDAPDNSKQKLDSLMKELLSEFDNTTLETASQEWKDLYKGLCPKLKQFKGTLLQIQGMKDEIEASDEKPRDFLAKSKDKKKQLKKEMEKAEKMYYEIRDKINKLSQNDKQKEKLFEMLVISDAYKFLFEEVSEGSLTWFSEFLDAVGCEVFFRCRSNSDCRINCTHFS